ncbi:MAG: ABC transporter permease, partial [Dehalococcoidia bacterium]|nr:ABC transporter permease [Dehalococcoidia bacterium]
MNLNHVGAVAQRIVRQMLRDRRTLVFIVAVPMVVMELVGLSFPGDSRVLDRMAPALMATFAMFFVFLLTGISFLRERSQGTLERVMVSPVSRLDLVVGYLGGFILFAAVQSLIILLFTVFVLGIQYQGALWQIFVFQLVVTVVALNLGLFVSAFARNEFQVVQFIPLVLVPQILLSGVLLPTDQMPAYLKALSKVLPLTFAVDGLNGIMLQGKTLVDVGWDLLILA